VEPSLESAHSAEVEWQEVEEQRAVGLSRQGNHLSLLLVRRFVVHHLQISGLTAETGAVIDDFAVYFSGGKVDKTQNPASV
jgi:hypothetical protein